MNACDVQIRPVPHPYRAMLAICSDLDETPDRHVYWEIMRFLNTTETTAMGPGVGLEVGNSIYFDMPPGQFAYWSTDDAGRAAVRALIQSGHIDCLHSYGDLATARWDAGRALDELARHGCRLEVWVDHAVAPSNFGSDIMRGSGDVPESPVYHADLTTQYGIRYVWRGRVTSVIGQDVPRRLAGVFQRRTPRGSARTVLKEAAKGWLARLGNQKYAMHAANRVHRRVRLRDGRIVREFLRSNPYWDGVQHGATADGIAEVLTRPVLDRLVQRGGTCILYTHLGKIRSRTQPFNDQTCQAFRRLAEYSAAGQILMTTTRRLLGFRTALEHLRVQTARDNGGWRIDLSFAPGGPGEPPAVDFGDLAGLTLDVAADLDARLFWAGRELTTVQRQKQGAGDRVALVLPRRRLEFPRL